MLLPAKLMPTLLLEVPSGPATGRCCDGALSSWGFISICKLIPKIKHEVPHPALAPVPVLKAAQTQQLLKNGAKPSERCSLLMDVFKGPRTIASGQIDHREIQRNEENQSQHAKPQI